MLVRSLCSLNKCACLSSTGRSKSDGGNYTSTSVETLQSFLSINNFYARKHAVVYSKRL